MYGYELAVYQNSNPLLGSSRGCNLKTICIYTGAKKSKHVCNIYVRKATYIFGETMEERDMKINPQL
jgi:hypothetical protein|tara:strand:+ start:414 stop:614 length:201 start_codon:yes stop_codon:yes gene_type:complete